MPFTQNRFVGPTTLTTSASSALYTVATGYSAVIKQIVVTNTTASARTFTIYVGAAASASTAIFSGTQIAANDSVVINTSQVLNAGDKIFALADAGSAVNLTISGVVNDGPLSPNSTYLADNQVTTNKIADLNVTTGKIADSAVTSAKIADNTITQTDLSTDIPLSGMRNVLINGNFAIWQRGTGSIAPANGAMTNTDRWLHTGNTTTFTQQTDVPQGFTYSLGVSGSDPSFAQRIESLNAVRLAGTTVTFSVWAKSISGTTSLFVNFYYPNTTDTFSSLTTISSNTLSVSPSSSWTRYTLTTTLPSDVSKGLQVLIGRSAGASNTYFTGAQIEVGSQATPFEQRSYGTELMLCKRYYEKSYEYPTAPASNSAVGQYELTVMCDASGYPIGNITFNVPKRSNSYSVTFYRPTGADNTWELTRYTNAGSTFNAMVADAKSTDRCRIYTSAATAAAREPCRFGGHWVVNDEL